MVIRQNEDGIIFENGSVSFVAGKNGKALSLYDKENKEELLADSDTPLFCVSQDRFFDNEMKLIHPSRKETIYSDSIRYENGSLIVGFSPLPYEARIDIYFKNGYFVFTLADFLFPENAYGGILIARPPAVSLRFLNLHLKNRKYFGEWLNVCHDDRTAVAVMGTAPHTFIGHESTRDGKLLFAEARKGILFKGCSAVLIVSDRSRFLDIVEAFEDDFGLPQGVKSRRSNKINASAYFVSDAVPDNIDEHLTYARLGGFSMMLFYYTCFVKEKNGYSLCGNYELRDEYGGSVDNIGRMLERVRAYGITPGFHFLHSHIGVCSKYFTPEADHRIMLRQRLTLAEDISAEDTVIPVDQYPFETELHEYCRVLRFGNELIHYEACTDTAPYCYTGCVRGYNGTVAQPHSAGTGGGVVFISEFGGTSGYCDQNSSLQDELAEKIAQIYNQGFEFVYFDGSEGVNAPYEFQIPVAQYRVYKKFNRPPLFAEAAAKGHFSWHILSGGNAFDIFPTDIFKAMIRKYPLREASDMRMDFTRINFGWWGFYPDSRPDVFEYGTSHAAGYDCPVTIQSNLAVMRENPRIKDNLEVFRRWEYVRSNNLLTKAQKEMLRDPEREFALLKNSRGEPELTECFPVRTDIEEITVYCFERDGKGHVMMCHNSGAARVVLPVREFTLRGEMQGEIIPTEPSERGRVFTLSDRCCAETSLALSELSEILPRIKKVEE